ncbi:MAG: succinylglutamate desuccinylase/aspartoacylase family protein [Bryobacteraceae bacterium]
MSWFHKLPAGSCGWRTWDATSGARLELFCCRGHAEGPLVLITAGVHGDEYEGPAAVFSLAESLIPDRLHGTVIAVPVVNPAAFAAGTRLHPEDGRNLARTFPGDTGGSPTEQLAAAIFTELAAPADYLIDLHSGGVEYVFLPVAGFYGDALKGNASYRAAQAFGLPALWQLPPTDGVLSCEAWRRGKVVVGCEYLGAGQLSQDGVHDYRNGVLACLEDWGLLERQCRTARPSTAFEGDWVLASEPGIFTSFCRLGDEVRAGTLLASTRGLRGQVVQEFRGTAGGMVLGLRSKAYIGSGSWAVLVGRRMETNG